MTKLQGIFQELNALGHREENRYRVQYELKILGEETLLLEPFLGKYLRLAFTGNIACQGCGKPIKKTFQTGMCFLCSQRLARCDLCIVRPERCHFHLGTCREPEWGKAHCMQDHCIYLANSSGIKVGITRMKNIPTRWMDQGAIQALPILTTSSRRLSGLIEVAIAKHIPDKTNWRKMLKNEVESVDLLSYRDQIFKDIQSDLADIASLNIGTFEWTSNPEFYEFVYPVLKYPTQIESLSFDKTPVIEGVLQGIKGQYLILDVGVLNLGKFEGYELSLR